MIRKTKNAKTSDITRGYKTEGTGKRRKLKRYQYRIKTIQTKGHFKTTQWACGGRLHEDISRKAKLFWRKIWERRDHNKSWTDKHGKSAKTRRRVEEENTLRFIQSNTQKIQIWKKPSHDGIHGHWFKKSNSIPVEMNRCLEETNIPEWKTKGKATLIKKN